jgi:hypothetical protein
LRKKFAKTFNHYITQNDSLFFVNFFLENLTTEFLENFRIIALDTHENALQFSTNAVLSFSKKKFTKICVFVHPILGGE